ncbi:hypothetical protein [Kitasatospora sp. MAP5-34]|uniref:hypothetical protein n=1 Tax=Kitasatospora sp. MAP5-34 TaxID=3035102 RepID=UPI0024755F99|nr:hypothetical protein [Kitasatospora sp. MAP5-34]MDH6577555.1 hypothetical protein [Kitasatospora sp. MAP5-34]
MRTENANEAVQGMGRAELLALPAAIDLDTANRAIGLGRSKGYELARRDLYPCRVLRLGKKYRVITADLLRLLGIEDAVVNGLAADAA